MLHQDPAAEARIVAAVRKAMAEDIRQSEDRIVSRLLAELRGTAGAGGGQRGAGAAALFSVTEVELNSVLE